jgi:putative endonuclease
MSNSLPLRLANHYFSQGNPKTFAGRYNCCYLLYYEDYGDVWEAIDREKEIKGWSRAKKVALINSKNPDWKFLNLEVCECWPPKEKPDWC